jgi:diacylglycerol kinase (ATP)
LGLVHTSTPSGGPVKDWFVILNPEAGSADDIETLSSAIARLGEVDLSKTENVGDAERLAREAVSEGYRTIVAAGGDGTLHEVLNGASERLGEVRLGLLPVGTGNDLARSLAIPDDLGDAVEVLATGKVRTVDAYAVVSSGQRRLAVNGSAGGFSTKVDEKLSQAIKERLGAIAYVASAGRALPELERYDLRVLGDDGEWTEVEAYNFVVSNGCYIGGGIPVAPAADLGDGLLDLMIVPALPLTELAATMVQILRGTHLESSTLIQMRSRRIELDSRPELAFTVDGELWGRTPAVFEVIPGAVRVLAP